MLDINSKKTKITSFKKRVKKNLDLEFYKRKQTIDIVHENRYLGTRTSSTGNVSLEHLREKALLALFDLWKNAGISRLKPSLACKIFEAMTTPILSYNCEIWGANQKQDFKTWDGSPTEKAPATTKVLLILK